MVLRDEPEDPRKLDWPDVRPCFLPIGESKLVRKDYHATVVSYARTLPLCVPAADQLAHDGLGFDVIDLRTRYPVDMPALRRSLAKTRRLLVVNEDTEVTNYGEHLIRRLTEEFFYDLDVAPRLLAGKDVPGVGIAWSLESASVPQAPDVLEVMRDVATAPGRVGAREWPLLPETFFRNR